MRSIVILVLGALSLASCGKKEGGDQTTAATQNLSVDSIGGNDVTAIDAATASDANMAEDVELTVNDLGDLNASDAEETSARTKKAPEKREAETAAGTGDDAIDTNAD